MKKLLVVLVLVSFGCSLAMANDNVQMSNPDFVIQKKEIIKANPNAVEKVAPNWVVVKETPADNAVFNGSDINKPELNSTPSEPDQHIILQGGDTINDAVEISAIDYSNTGTTSGYTNDYDETCPYSGSTSPDVVYSYTPSEDIYVDIDLYGSSYDTKLYVYENEVTEGYPYGCNDDYYDNCTSALINLELTGGNTYYIVIDGFDGAEGDYAISVTEGEVSVDLCPYGSVYSQTPIEEDGSWLAYTSESDAYGYMVYTDYTIDSGTISGITVFGITMEYDSDSSWSVCNETEPSFNVVFYEDNEGLPGIEVASFDTVEATMSETEYIYSDSCQLYQFDMELPSTVSLTSGWISVQGAGNPEECWFLWINGYGEGESAYQWDGSDLNTLDDEVAFCLAANVEEGIGETCYDPLIVNEFPFYDDGNTCDFTDDCDIFGLDTNDVIYEIEINEAVNLVVSLYGSDYDTKLTVYQTECCSGPDNYFLFDDDYYSDYTSEVKSPFPAGTYYVVVDGFETECGNYVLNIYEYEVPVPGCDQGYVDPDSSWTFFVSDTERGPYKLFDNFLCEDAGAISGITYWGVDTYYNNGWYECEENPTTMDIVFYPSTEGGSPDVDNPTCVYEDISPTISDPGVIYNDYYYLVQYDVTFDTPCDIDSGWISIQGTYNTDDSCIFMWLNSFDGDTISYQDMNGLLEQISYDFSREFQYIVDIDDDITGTLPETFSLDQNYPNPFNAHTEIKYSLASDSDVKLEVYNVLGQKVTTLVDANQTAGYHSLIWNGTNDNGQVVSSGTYLYKLITDEDTFVKKMIMLK